MKRLSKPKPGEIIVQWGKLPYDSPDICFSWGDGAHKYDARFISSALTGERQTIDHLTGRVASYGPSIIDELVARGYDITTLRFSISKKQNPG